VAEEFFSRIVERTWAKKLLSDKHFAVDGTLIEAWAGQRDSSAGAMRILKATARSEKQSDGQLAQAEAPERHPSIGHRSFGDAAVEMLTGKSAAKRGTLRRRPWLRHGRVRETDCAVDSRAACGTEQQ
jgi:SOS response regulatory protein OraA/RecX